MKRRVVLAFATGIAAGVALTVWLTGDRNVRSATPEAVKPAAGQFVFPPQAGLTDTAPTRHVRPEAVEPAPNVRPHEAAVTVTVLDELRPERPRVTSAYLGKARLVVLPLPALRGAGRLLAEDSSGYQQFLGEVAAVDEESGLVAFTTDFSHAPYLELALEEHPLYLGRDLELIAPYAQLEGWVDGSLMEVLVSEHPLVPVRFSEGLHERSGFLVPPGGSLVVGMLFPGTNNAATPTALEADAIRSLLARANAGATRSLAAVLEQYFLSSPVGMWQEVVLRHADQDWKGVMDLGARLLESSPRHRAPLVKLLESALVEQTNAYLLANDHGATLDWLRSGEVLLGESPAVLTAYAKTYTAMRDYDAAREVLLRLSSQGVMSDGAVRLQLRRVVGAQVRSLRRRRDDDAIIALLTQIVRRDPDYAPFHQDLGRAYFRQRDYGRSLKHLSRAVELDVSLDARLDRLIQQAQVKLSIPELTEVGFLRVGGGIYVDVRLNGNPRIYRFVLDTGASYTVVARSAAEELGIPVTATTPRVRVRTASEEVEAPMVFLDSVDLGGATVSRVRALVMEDLGGPDGLVGLSYLNHFDVTIEQDTGVVSLRRK